MTPQARLLGLLWGSLVDLGAVVHWRRLEDLTAHEIAAETAWARERLRVLTSPDAGYRRQQRASRTEAAA